VWEEGSLKKNDNTIILTSTALFHRTNMTMLALTIQIVTATKMAGFVSHFILRTEINLFSLSRNKVGKHPLSSV